jgi:hypothetical protein
MSIRHHLSLVGFLALCLGRAAAGPYGLTNGSADPAPRPDELAPAPPPVPSGAVAQPVPPADLNPWSGGSPLGRAPQKAGGKAEGGWGSLTAQTTVQEGAAPSAWEEPAWKRSWQTNESYRLPLAGPLSVFGQLGANSDEAAQQNMQVTGQTGLACQLPLGPAANFQVRSGPRVAYTDPLRPDRTSSRSDWLLEVQARLPLLARVGLEYQGTAAPALTPLDHDWINQDLHLAIPVGAAGKFQLGAKHKWQDSAGSRTGTDSTQVYLGLELSR